MKMQLTDGRKVCYCFFKDIRLTVEILCAGTSGRFSKKKEEGNDLRRFFL